jgi:uncharacterized protein YlxW (UPF0749 family)
MPRRAGAALAWRLLVPLTVGGAALLLVTSANTAHGTDLRASAALQVNQRIALAERQVAQLNRQVAVLRARISSRTSAAAVTDSRVAAARRAEGPLAAAAGLTPVTGPALSVSLDDAPKSAQQRDLAAGAQPDDLVIHQQDVQGVVNALWAGGAEAMTIMGQRVVATTAVRCVGNTLLLHGRSFGPPFVVTAIGSQPAMLRALDAAPDVQVFRQYVDAYGLGYTVRTSSRVRLPGYTGALELTRAQAG